MGPEQDGCRLVPEGANPRVYHHRDGRSFGPTPVNPSWNDVANRRLQTLDRRMSATQDPRMSAWWAAGGSVIILGRYVDDLFLLYEDGNVVVMSV